MIGDIEKCIIDNKLRLDVGIIDSVIEHIAFGLRSGSFTTVMMYHRDAYTDDQIISLMHMNIRDDLEQYDTFFKYIREEILPNKESYQ